MKQIKISVEVPEGLPWAHDIANEIWNAIMEISVRENGNTEDKSLWISVDIEEKE